MPDLKSMSYDELAAFVNDLGEPSYRTGQIFEWLHKRMVSDPDAMSNIPKALKESLRPDLKLSKLEVADVLESKHDGTKKFLFRLSDGNVIESVLMKYEHGYSVCISSQVGCAMGCRFCASGIGGKVRDLTAGEMLEQIYHISTHEGVRISNVVVMGTGEPFDNFDNFCRFYELLTDKRGFDLSGRSITVSTCGLVEKIYELARREYTLTLAISLHAPNDGIRLKLMPVAKRYRVEDIIKACDDYYSVTGRRITFEYSLVSGINDDASCAEELSKLLKGKNCHVNLIPVNPVKERKFSNKGYAGAAAFKNILEKNGINATIRRGMGEDIDAACGQLRRRYMENLSP